MRIYIDSRFLQIPLVGNIFVEIARKYIPTTDGMFIASSSAYDGKSVEGLKEWFGARGKDIYPVGPLSLPGPPSSQEKGKAVVEFLDEMQAKCGEKSVIYASSYSITASSTVLDMFPLDVIWYCLLAQEPRKSLGCR